MRPFILHLWFVKIDFETDFKTFLNALYELAAHPEYATPLREEIEAVTEKGGWTKASVMQLRKLDSFIKESIRIHSLTHCLSLPSPPSFQHNVY